MTPPVYNIGDCAECCPACEYSILIEVFLASPPQSYIHISNPSGIFLQGAGIITYDSGGVNFAAQYVTGASASYDGSILTVTFPDGQGGTITVNFTNVSVDVTINDVREYRSNTCSGN